MKRILLIATLVIGYSTHAFAQFTLTDSLIAWYPMDGNDSDYSGHHHDIQYNTATLAKDRFNKLNHAYFMNGSDTVTVPSFRLNNYTGITYSAWIKTDGSSDFMSIIQFPPHIIWLSRFTMNHFMAALDGSSWNNSTSDESTVSVAGTEWKYITVTNNGDTTSLYLNGKLNHKYAEKLYQHNYDFHIGCLTKTDNGNNFKGYIDDVRVYTRALSASEITRLYDGSNAGIQGLNDDMSVLVYPNPVRDGKVYIDMPTSTGKVTVQIMDQEGRLIKEGEIAALPSGSTFETGNIAAGTYFLRIILGEKVSVKELVIEK